MATKTDELREPLERWLGEHLLQAESIRVGKFSPPISGYSAETIIFPVRLRRDGKEVEERLVLRREVPGPASFPQQAPGLDVEVEIQYRAMEALSRFSKAPLAPLIGYESDATVLGAPFFVMEFIDGEVPKEHPPYTQEGFFADATPEERRSMAESGLGVLAEVHRVDWRTAGLEWLVPPGTTPGLAVQLDLWERFARRELRDRVHPALDESFAWLHANLPTNLAVGLSWGDSRPGNMIWRDFQCVCIMDFEHIAIAPPEIDLGWWLMFDRCAHEVVGVDRLPGEPTREEQCDLYAAFSGREIGDTYYFELFAAMRYAAVVVRIMNRWVERGDLPADQMIWLENPAAACLADLLRIRHPQSG